MTKKEEIKAKTKEKLEDAKTKLKEVRKNARSKVQNSKQPLAPHKLVLLITVVPRSKAEFFLDLLQQFEVNLQMEVSAYGTARKGFGLLESDLEKQALFSIIREDNLEAAEAALEDKFATIRGGKGIACAIPFTSMIGVAAYQFLSNKQ